MKLTKDQKQELKTSFIKIKSLSNFVTTLNLAKSLIYGDNTYPIKPRQITYHAFHNPNKYTYFYIRKRSGKRRPIHAPKKGLMVIQKSLNLVLQVVYENHLRSYVTGFVTGKSIIDNAKRHVGRNYVYNIDLKDFFPSIDQARIWGRLQYPPFHLNKDNGTLKIANIIAALCCQNMEVERLDENGKRTRVEKSILPQGAPTSPILSNIICQHLDFYLNAASERFGVTYSRYADDITFSSDHNLYYTDSEFLKEVHRVISDQGFQINPAKTRLQRKAFRQEVTGLLVNDKVNVSSKYIKGIRQWLYFWEKYGYDKASVFFHKKYLEDNGKKLKELPNLKNVVRGKLDYLKMVKGPENPTYLKLKERYNRLNQNFGTDLYMPDLLEGWENEAITKATEQYHYEKNKGLY